MLINTQNLPHAVAKALEAEASLPVLGYQINGDSVLREGTRLELGHPATSQPALFIGEFHLPRNSNPRDTCVFQTKRGVDGRLYGDLRRFRVEKVNGAKILSRADENCKTIYLHVDPTVQMAPNTRVMERFYFGVSSTCTMVAKGGAQRLVALENDDDFVDILYIDGRVVRVIRYGDRLIRQALDIIDGANVRIDHALRQVTLADRVIDQRDRAAQKERSYHELASVLCEGGRRSEVVFQRVFEILEEVARERNLSRTVRQHVLDALDRNGKERAYFADNYCRDLKEEGGGRFMQFGATEHKGVPLHRKAKKALRAERDAALRLAMQNPGGKKN